MPRSGLHLLQDRAMAIRSDLCLIQTPELRRIGGMDGLRLDKNEIVVRGAVMQNGMTKEFERDLADGWSRREDRKLTITRSVGPSIL
jgi:hypothetical protein